MAHPCGVLPAVLYVYLSELIVGKKRNLEQVAGERVILGIGHQRAVTPGDYRHIFVPTGQERAMTDHAQVPVPLGKHADLGAIVGGPIVNVPKRRDLEVSRAQPPVSGDQGLTLA
jgi:hypothetical protein